MKIPNSNINGITYIDCTLVNKADQQPCPLQDCGLGHLCVNEYQDPRLRSEHCEHQEFCGEIRSLHLADQGKQP